MIVATRSKFQMTFLKNEGGFRIEGLICGSFWAIYALLKEANEIDEMSNNSKPQRKCRESAVNIDLFSFHGFGLNRPRSNGAQSEARNSYFIHGILEYKKFSDNADSGDIDCAKPSERVIVKRKGMFKEGIVLDQSFSVFGICSMRMMLSFLGHQAVAKVRMFVLVVSPFYYLGLEWEFDSLNEKDAICIHARESIDCDMPFRICGEVTRLGIKWSPVDKNCIVFSCLENLRSMALQLPGSTFLVDGIEVQDRSRVPL
ncbi:hypothetical protein Tco_0751675 [Tanacetum coccineum]|uniref:Uncharacterized protein n=1 Tax=Tanacetum coccineum TaxID=301880 RepID=A0ABQ4Z4P2_9ASTR